MSYIGKKGVSRLDPENLYDFQRAEQMRKEGFDAAVIKIRTGWEQGIDGFWRYEIPDPFMDTAAIEDFVKSRYGEALNVRLILHDKRILDAYPEFEKLNLYAMYSSKKGTAGYYNPSTNGMVVSMSKQSDAFEYQIEGVLLHEIQHLIQEVEGFAEGGDPKVLGWRRYYRLAGEVEARNICARHFLTEEERRRTLRTETQDVPDNNQILSLQKKSSGGWCR